MKTSRKDKTNKLTLPRLTRAQQNDSREEVLR